MDTSTGAIYENNDEVMAALKNGRIKDPANIVQLPPDIAAELIGMNRKGRRLWWKQNRKRLNLPRWSEQSELKDSWFPND